MELAFSAGYDPALELANRARKQRERTSQENKLQWDGLDEPWTHHLRREDQDQMDRIVRGSEAGRYYLLLGPKVGTKSEKLGSGLQT